MTSAHTAEITTTLGVLISATAKAAGLTQKDVAARAGLTTRVLRSRLNGSRDLTVGELHRLALALDTDAALWLGRLEHMFDPHLPVNSEMPPKVPLKPQGSRPVIVRMLWLDREEFTPGRAIRWTATHVMVSWLADPADPRTELSCWFRADDVSTNLPKRR